MNESPEKFDLRSLDVAAGQREKLRQLQDDHKRTS
jgi:hypothetical protein